MFPETRHFSAGVVHPNVPNAQNISVLNLLEMTSGLDSTGPMGDAPYNNDDANAQKMIQDTHIMNRILASGIIKI